MNGHLLLTLLDHAKPFKGSWQIYKQTDTQFSACHSPCPAPQGPEASCCQVFTSHQQLCRFTALLQFYGWSIEGQTPESLRFRQACAI